MEKCETCLWDTCANEYCLTCDGEQYYSPTESEQIRALKEENARLRELVRVAYVEGVSDTFDFGITNGYQGWDDSHAKADLYRENT